MGQQSVMPFHADVSRRNRGVGRHHLLEFPSITTPPLRARALKEQHAGTIRVDNLANSERFPCTPLPEVPGPPRHHKDQEGCSFPKRQFAENVPLPNPQEILSIDKLEKTKTDSRSNPEDP